MTIDRLSDDYQPKWDIDAKVGRQAELFVADICQAMADGASVEVKSDAAATKWGNIYLEHACLKGGEWHKSGLANTSAELWAQVLGGDIAIVAPTWRYRAAGKRAWQNERNRREMRKGSHPTDGVTIPLPQLLTWLLDA